ncbi:sensor histidine kinase [Streptomyces sp. ISL-66]|uniref:sensor histidine kinase n=1 Tax=Streptomyces sp. ISL-66 TaxID=2819186 RepID=UPI001BE939C6|nr:sensor histidine kinase [Streptomyces sp. ISL-66]MBT2467395.1 sensor histidine kinase [Streptomyces sp. ISL-66]
MAGSGGRREAPGAGVLQERNRLAAELHDTVAQGLTSMHMLLDAADRQWTREPGQARVLVRQAAAAARENLAQARRLIHDLAPPELDGTSLPQALRRMCAAAQTGAGAGAGDGDGVSGASRAPGAPGGRVRFRVVGEARGVGGIVEGAVVRAVQGALGNVRRHARASEAVVTLTYQPDAVVLDVWDDGVGFDPAELRGDGLRLLRRRIEYLGGTAVVESTPGGGTVVSVCLPAPAGGPA